MASQGGSEVDRVTKDRTQWRWLPICLSFLLTVPDAVPARAGPRDTVDEIATLIENNYFDPAKSHDIAQQLRFAKQAGDFDALTDPRDLATALTRRLHPLDHHFRVSWSRHAATISEVSSETMGRRTAFGFTRVEMLPGAVGYIVLSSFAELGSTGAEDPARDAADAALRLVSDADALIIDLRDDIGGSLDMVGYLVSAFMPGDANVYDLTQRRDETVSERPKRPYPSPRLDVPLYLLTSARTASSAEALAYTLRASRRALVVGEVSAGAANPGGTFPIDDGFAIFISTGKAINPVTGTSWEGRGITPDYPVVASAALASAHQLALASVLASRPDGPDAAYIRLVLEALRAASARPGGRSLGDYAGHYDDAVVSADQDGLSLRQGRRIPLKLMRVKGDIFFDRDEPSRRIIFERTAAGTIRGFELIYANGHSVWFPDTALRSVVP
jgi:hypothetical protein